MGRAYQRKDLTFGVPAEPNRQDTVMHTAVSVMADICRRWLLIMGLQSEVFDVFALDFEQYNARFVESGHELPQPD